MEKVSALMDSELEAAEAAHEITRIKQTPVLRDGWDTWHLIGDTLRGSQPLSSQFGERLSQRLAMEPTVMAPRLRLPPKAQTYALSAAASVAAIATVAWMAFSTQQPEKFPRELAQAPAPAATIPVAAVPQAQVFEGEPATGHMHEYLLAHQGISPSTAIQGVAPYIRTVSSINAAPDPR